VVALSPNGGNPIIEMCKHWRAPSGGDSSSRIGFTVVSERGRSQQQNWIRSRLRVGESHQRSDEHDRALSGGNPISRVGSQSYLSGRNPISGVNMA